MGNDGRRNISIPSKPFTPSRGLDIPQNTRKNKNGTRTITKQKKKTITKKPTKNSKKTTNNNKSNYIKNQNKIKTIFTKITSKNSNTNYRTKP